MENFCFVLAQMVKAMDSSMHQLVWLLMLKITYWWQTGAIPEFKYLTARGRFCHL
jgi:hypothetical protein